MRSMRMRMAIMRMPVAVAACRPMRMARMVVPMRMRMRAVGPMRMLTSCFMLLGKVQAGTQQCHSFLTH